MELKRYQWVGLLAGFPLFSGAWLSAFYDNYWPGLIGLAVTAVGLFLANRVERQTTRQEHISRGLIAGILAGIVARVLGGIAAATAGVSAGVGFEKLDDMNRVVLAGGWLGSLLLVLVIGALGVIVTAFEPEAKKGGRS